MSQMVLHKQCVHITQQKIKHMPCNVKYLCISGVSWANVFNTYWMLAKKYTKKKKQGFCGW